MGMIVDHQVVELQSCVSVPAEVHHAWDLSARSARQTLGISAALIEAMSKAMQSSNQMPPGKRHWLWKSGQRLEQDAARVRGCFAFLV